MADFDPDKYLERKKRSEPFDPDRYLAKTRPETPLQTLGRSTASLADTALNAITGTLDYGAYNLARAFGRSPEQATAETTSPKDVVGRAFGVTGTPGYEQAIPRQVGRAIGETLSENVIQPIARTTGIPEQDVGSMLTTATMGAGPAAGRGVATAGRGVATAGRGVGDVVSGAAGRATGYIAKPGETPTGYQVPSSRIKLGETFIPAKEMAALERGMPISEGAIRPISELAPGPVLALSGGEIPVAGRAARAFGERIGETYANPYTAAADIGSMFLTGGVPVLTAGRGALGLAQAGADAYLARKGFRTLTPEQQNLLNQGINPFYTPPTSRAPGPVSPAMPTAAPANVPLLPYNPTPPTMYVAPEGVASTNMRAANMAGIQQKYPPGGMPAAAAMQAAAAQRVVGAPPISGAVKPLTSAPSVGKTPEQLAAEQRILDFINQKRGIVTNEPAAVVKAQTPTEITEAIKTTGRGAVSSKDKVVSVNRELYNDAAGRYGVTLDWTQAPDVKGMSLADARAAMDKFVTKQVKSGVGPFERGPQMRTLQRQAEAELGITGKEELTPEMRQRLAAPVTGPVVPEGVTPSTQTAGISDALRIRLEQLQKKKGTPPEGVSQMMTMPEIPTTFANKQEFLSAQMLDKLAGRVTQGSYIDAGKLYVHKDVGPPGRPMEQIQIFDAKTGKRIYQPGEEMTSGDLIRQRMNKGKQ